MTYVGRLAMIVKLNLPAPLAAVLGIPPTDQLSHFPARQDDQPSDIFWGGPNVFTRDLFTLQRKPRNGPVGGLRQVFGIGEPVSSFTPHFDSQCRRRGMDQ